jgi:glyoxylase-like metal-dependent hydrolase (beta-lactamase superfamily II)
MDPDPGKLVETLTLGQTRIHSLLDASTRQPAAEMYENVEPPYPIADLPRRLPREFDDAGWILTFRAFLVQSPDGVTLIDCGVGPAWTDLAQVLGSAGRLPDLLTQLGVGPEEITNVVMTHFHADHIGWAVADESGRLTFPRATYHLGRADMVAAEDGAVTDKVLEGRWRRIWVPLRDSGRLRLHDGTPDQITPSISLMPTPGHTPGHSCVRLEVDGVTVVFTGDMLHLTYQLVPPYVSDPYDMSYEGAQKSRGAALTALAAEPGRVVLASPHLPDPFTEWGAKR